MGTKNAHQLPGALKGGNLIASLFHAFSPRHGDEDKPYFSQHFQVVALPQTRLDRFELKAGDLLIHRMYAHPKRARMGVVKEVFGRDKVSMISDKGIEIVNIGEMGKYLNWEMMGVRKKGVEKRIKYQAYPPNVLQLEETVSSDGLTTHFYADTHCHTSLLPLNRFNGNMEPANVDTEAGISSLKKGKVVLVFASLYPVEQTFMKIYGIGTGLKAADDLLDGALDKVRKFITKFSKTRINEIIDVEFDYFKDLSKEYHMVNEGKGHYFIANNYSDIKTKLNIDVNNCIKEEPSQIALVLNIEGGSCFGFAQRSQHLSGSHKDDYQYDKYLKFTEKWDTPLSPEIMSLWDELKIPEKVLTVKAWNVFSINLTHHFWNQLCGHAMSLYALNGKALNQRNHLGAGITDLGWKLIKELLDDTKGGRKVYIDVKHMSVKSRTQYYKYLIYLRKEKSITVPVIYTHSAINEFKTNAEAEKAMNLVQGGEIEIDNGNKAYNESSLFNPWDINMSDEDILMVNDSKGLIGISLDERILMGSEMNKKLSHFVNSWEDKEPSKEQYINPWVEALIINIMYIISVVVDINSPLASQWISIKKLITLSSDFDGFIHPIKGYKSTTNYHDHQLAKSLINRLNEIKKGEWGMFYKSLNSSSEKKLANELAIKYELYQKILTNSDISIDIPDFVEGICYKNVMYFLERYFR
jgi:microsomal dipeptidase-like Zn-dependent dipeptidase